MNEPLKILLVLEAAGGGAGRHVIDLARCLHENGHIVHLAYSPLRMESGFQQDLQQLSGITVTEISMRRSPHLSDIRALWALRNYVRQRGGFDIVHGHSSKAGALVRLLRMVGTGRRAGALVYTPHGLRTIDTQLSSRSRRVWAGIERVLNIVGGNHSIAVSTHERDHMIEQSICGPSRVSMIMNGLAHCPSDNRAARRREFGLADDDFVAGFVGRFSRVKGPLVFVDAISTARRTAPGLRAVMLGYGEMRDAVGQRMQEYQLNDILQIHEDRRAVDCMSAFDVLVVSSYQEGLPYAVLEGMAAGLPVVATDVGGLSQLVDNNHTGCLVPVGDAVALGEQLARLANHEADYRRLCDNVRRQRDRFTAEQMTEHTVTAYRRQLSLRRQPDHSEQSTQGSHVKTVPS